MALRAKFLVLRLALLVLGLQGIVLRADSDEPSATYTHVVPIAASETAESILAKAARLVPNRPQQLYHLDEFSAFIHFGPNTFSGVEWGNGQENPAIFDPGDTLDTDQWCEALRSAGMRKVILTAKHHDGFCLWQTRYNSTFSVRATPWRNGQGDCLRQLSDSCRKYGLKLGLYLSPADLYQIENTEHGLYGNGSSYQPSTIPTAVDSFRSKPTTARSDRPAGAPTFQVNVDDYNRYFMNQLYEILTEYGPIHEVWFDGAHPKRKGGQTYAKKEWFAMIRTLAPEAAIFGGPDLRWCGNEGGQTREAEWSVLPTESEEVSGEDRPDPSPGSDEALTARAYSVYGKAYESRELRYLIAEVNTSIREGWFWRNEDEQSVRGPDDVFDIYERAVGGNAGFLLNVPPDRSGRLAARDAACLQEVGRRIRDTYGNHHTHDAIVENAPQVLDGDLRTYWQSDAPSGQLLVTLPEPRLINRWVLQEAIFEVGQRIKAHALDAWIDGAWHEVASGTTVGFKKILRFSDVRTDRFRVRILDSRLYPTLAEMSAHYYQQPPLPVTARHDASGQLTLELTLLDEDFRWNRSDRRVSHDTDQVAQIVYTLDESEPTASSTVYTGPFSLPAGGKLQARSLRDGKLGPITGMWLERSKQGWKIRDASKHQETTYDASRAIDGDPKTCWVAAVEGQEAQSAPLILDLGEDVSLAGFTYLPATNQGDASSVADAGSIESGRIEVSRDGENWSMAERFQFGNIVNDPSQRRHLLALPQRARYLRLTVDTVAAGKKRASAAELGVLSK